MMSDIVTIISVFAGVILGILSNWFYDVLRIKTGLLPKNPSSQRIVVVFIAMLPLITLVTWQQLQPSSTKEQLSSIPSQMQNVKSDSIDTNTVIQSNEGPIIIDSEINYWPDKEMKNLPSPVVPEGARRLPSMSSDILAFTIEPWSSMWDVSLINTPLNDLATPLEVDTLSVIRPGNVSPIFVRHKELSIVRINIIGHPGSMPVQISSRLPIRLISFSPLPPETHILSNDGPVIGGGGDNYWLLHAALSKQTSSNTKDLLWATHSADFRNKYLPLVATSREEFLPEEVKRAVLNASVEFPDFFILNDGDVVAFSVGLELIDPGVYSVQFGIEYLYSDYSAIMWQEQEIDIYSFGSYQLWTTNGLPDVYCTIEDDRYECK